MTNSDGKMVSVPKIRSSTVLKLSFTKSPPFKSEKDYRTSRLVNICEMTKPEWDKTSLSSIFDWIEAARALVSATGQLEAMRVQVGIEYAQNDDKWHELQDKQLSLRQMFINFERFQIENEEKRKRARRKIYEERVLLASRTAKLNECAAELKLLTDVKHRMEQKIKSYRIYEDYLLQVVGREVQFKNISAIIKRVVVLIQTKEMVSDRREHEMDSLDEAKFHAKRLLDGKDTRIRELKNKLLDLTVRHDGARSRALMWEGMVHEIRRIIEQRQRELVTVRVSVWRTYKMMCARRETRIKVAKEDFEGQLVFINQVLEELGMVMTRVEKLMIGRKKYSRKSSRKTIRMASEVKG